jgi:hypothetical protein
MWIVLMVTLVYLLPILVKRDFQTMNFSIMLCAYVGLFFSFFISVSALSKFYVGLMTGLAAYSLVACYLLAPLVEKGWFSVPFLTFCYNY